MTSLRKKVTIVEPEKCATTDVSDLHQKLSVTSAPEKCLTESTPVQDTNAYRIKLAYAGCGFLGIYHVGVSSCFRKFARELPIECMAGASAGAMAAACLLTNANLSVIKDCAAGAALDVPNKHMLLSGYRQSLLSATAEEFRKPCSFSGVIRDSIVRGAAEARARTLGPLSPSYDINQLLKAGLSKVLPANAHELVSGRLYVSLTRVSDKSNVLISQFHSRDHLIEVLLCSSFIPVFSGLLPPSIDGVRYVDGGFTDNMPELDKATITVSPFAGEADICPQDTSAGPMTLSVTNTSFLFSKRNFVRLSQALFPPSPEYLKKICLQGFNDALHFLQISGLVTCSRCSDVWNRLSVQSYSNITHHVQESTEAQSLNFNLDRHHINKKMFRKGCIPAVANVVATESDFLTSVTSAAESCSQVCLWKSSCVNCPRCRSRLQEAVLMDSSQVIYEGDTVVEESVPITLPKVLRTLIALPLVVCVATPMKIALSAKDSLPSWSRLHHLTVRVARLAAHTLFWRNSAQDERDRSCDTRDNGKITANSSQSLGSLEDETQRMLAQQYGKDRQRKLRNVSESEPCSPGKGCTFMCISAPDKAARPLFWDTERNRSGCLSQQDS